SHSSPVHPDPPPFPTRRSSDLDVDFHARLDRLLAGRGLPQVPGHDDHAHEVEGAADEARPVHRAEGDERLDEVRIEERALIVDRSEEHTSELQSLTNLVCRLLL